MKPKAIFVFPFLFLALLQSTAHSEFHNGGGYGVSGYESAAAYQKLNEQFQQWSNQQEALDLILAKQQKQINKYKQKGIIDKQGMKVTGAEYTVLLDRAHETLKNAGININY